MNECRNFIKEMTKNMRTLKKKSKKTFRRYTAKKKNKPKNK